MDNLESKAKYNNERMDYFFLLPFKKLSVYGKTIFFGSKFFFFIENTLLLVNGSCGNNHYSKSCNLI